MIVREWPIPAWSRTLHIIGDTHFGDFSTVRRTKVASDIGRLPVPAHRFQIGDTVNLGQASEDTAAKTWLDALPGSYDVVLGNHDVQPADAGGSGRSVAAWAAAWGLDGPTYVREFDFCRVIVLGPDGPAMPLSAFTLEFLDQALGSAAGRPCVVLCHWPLRSTVIGPTSGAGAVWSSLEDFFHAKPDADLRAILAAHPNALAWVSGHTHSPLNQEGLVKAEPVGARAIASINAGALYYQGRSLEWHDPLVTAFLTFTEDELEVRYRDHGAGVWTHPPGQTDRAARFAL